MNKIVLLLMVLITYSASIYLRYIGAGWIVIYYWYILIPIYLFHLIVQIDYLWILNKLKIDRLRYNLYSIFSGIILLILTLFMYDCDDVRGWQIFNRLLGTYGRNFEFLGSEIGAIIFDFFLLGLILIMNLYMIKLIVTIKRKNIKINEA